MVFCDEVNVLLVVGHSGVSVSTILVFFVRLCIVLRQRSHFRNAAIGATTGANHSK